MPNTAATLERIFSAAASSPEGDEVGVAVAVALAVADGVDDGAATGAAVLVDAPGAGAPEAAFDVALQAPSPATSDAASAATAAVAVRERIFVSPPEERSVTCNDAPPAARLRGGQGFGFWDFR
jgi:hypothetical protein